MNILIFVMTMLMLLSLMTYARLESYRNSQAFQIIFKQYMQEKERSYVNTQAERVYQAIIVTEKEGKSAPKIDANPRISVGLFFDKKRDGKPKEWEQTKILFKKLIRTLYDKQPFYLKIEQERPSFLDDLISAITSSVDSLPDEKKLKTSVDLANLKLEDSQLDSLLYKMLHGAFYNDAGTQGFKPLKALSNTSKTGKKNRDAEVETSVDDEQNGDIAEFKSPEGYYSLLDFVTFSSKQKIRVFLASKEVLQAVFPDPSTVDTILEERQRLYRQAVSQGDEADTKQLEEAFKNQFERMKDPAIENKTLNFSVSKTNPKYYK